VLAESVAAVAAMALAYTYAGYPLLIAVAARVRPSRASSPPREVPLPMVTAVVPVWNGGAALQRKLESLLALDYPADRLEVLVFCDGCTDGSDATAQAIADQPASGGRVRVLGSEIRRGKPAALNRMIAAARGELILFGDVRQPLASESARALAAALVDPSVGCATGRLVLAGGAGSGAYWRYEESIRASESAFRGVVGMTGPIAMMRRADVVPLPETIILDDVWLPMHATLAGKRTRLVRDAVAYDAAFEDDREFGRKARTLAGNYQLLVRLPSLLSPFANPLWFETISHKVLRLVAPWWLLALLWATARAAFSADGAVMRAVFVSEVGFYLLAALGARAGRAAALARTFVVLNAAALVGLWRFMGRRQRITW
jgi:cellulose synthase/poly-beta-1,6-N-acetylglucosamine synthase-like glycosyltransferase